MKPLDCTSRQLPALIPASACAAIADAARTDTWERKPRIVRRFRITGHYGEGAELVVPTASWWAFRSAEKDAERHSQGMHRGNAA